MDTINSCRLCLIENKDSINIFGEEGTKFKIPAILSQHFCFKPKEDDKFPNIICKKCWNQLESFHIFYNGIIKIQYKFYGIISSDTFGNRTVKNNDFIDVKLKPNIIDKTNQSHKETIDGHSDNSETYGDMKIESTSLNDETELEHSEINEKDSAESPKPPSDCTELIEKRERKCKINNKNITKRTKFKKKTHSQPVDDEKAKVKKSLAQNDRYEEDKKIGEFYKLECQLCPKKYTKFADVKSHYRIEHGYRRGYVLCCNKKLFQRGELLQHLTWHLNPNAFRCQICNKKFIDHYGLKLHMHHHVPEEEKIFRCDVCGKGFAMKYHLSQHLRLTHISDEKKTHKCEQCGVKFGLYSVLQAHIRGVHKFANAHMCDICAKVFKTKTQCERHRVEHLDEKQPRLQCDICPAWLKNKHTLRSHMKRAHVETPQTCNICGKVSANKEALRSHIRYVHESERTHKCSVCDKAFKKPLILKEHMTSHTGGILYVCPYCPKTFNSNANLHSHRKKIHPTEWQRDKRTSSKTSLSDVNPDL